MATIQRFKAPGAAPRPGPPVQVSVARPAQSLVQRHGGSGDLEVDPARIGLARGGGQPLPEAVLAKMEAAFRADFKDVRIHIGAQAQRIGALAFTMGNEIYFAPGQYHPNTQTGQQLIGHELAHVIQQRQGRVRGSGSGISVVHDAALEAEADRLGMRAAATPVQRSVGPVASGSHMRVPNPAQFAQVAQLKRVLARSNALRGQIVQMHAAPRAAAQRPAGPQIVQRRTPRHGRPNTLTWSPPANKMTEPYLGADRLGVSGFNDTWKNAAMQEWIKNGTLFEQEMSSTTSIVFARVTSNALGKDQFVPWDGTGIDHIMSAKDLGTELLQIAKELEQQVRAGKGDKIPDWQKDYFSIFALHSTAHYGWGQNTRQQSQRLREVGSGLSRILPTQWAADSYYHDFDNSVPMLSRDNSSKGASQGGAIILPSKTRNMLMQQCQKVANDLQLILNNWGGGTVSGQLETHMEGVRDNLAFLTNFIDGALKAGKISTPVFNSMTSGYQSPVRF